MIESDFVDYYDVLQVSSNADADIIERVFRHLAKKFHPDNTGSGDNDRFRVLMEAYKTLSKPETRAAYDVKYTEHWSQKWQLASEACSTSAFEDDSETRESLLSLLYVQRRRHMRTPGMGELELSCLIRVPYELVDFHLWYLKAKGLVELLDNGMLAISAKGVDEVERGKLRIGPDRLIPYNTQAYEKAEGEKILQYQGHDRKKSGQEK
jgi:hypothetical protein